MDTIKFRAWDKYAERMYPWEAVKNWDFATVEWENYIFQQFIGRLDKEGREIFNGDILLGPYGTGTGLASTRYKDFATEVFYYAPLSEFRLKMPKDYGRYRFIPGMEECRIIGNIYETPLLLQQTNSKTK